MMKMKGKIVLTLLLTLIVGILFATMVYAAPSEDITIEFYTGDAIDQTINVNSIVKGVAKIKRGESLKLPTRTVAADSSYSWYTDDGRAWEGGSTVTFYESTKLHSVVTVDIYTADELKYWVSVGTSSNDAGCKVRLMNDIELNERPNFATGGTGYESWFFLNGHKITISSNVDYAWGGARHGSYFYGPGTIEYLGSKTFMTLDQHDTGGNHCRLFVGSGVTINAQNAILVRDGSGAKNNRGFPYVQIYGIVKCKTVLQMGNSANKHPRVEIYDGAQLSLNGTFLSHTNKGNQIDVIIRGGNITTNSTESFFSDENAVFTISGGSFTFKNEGDYGKLAEIVDTTAYKIIELTGSNDTVYKTVASSSPCNHEYALNNTLAASCGHATYDVFFCQKENCESQIRISYGSTTSHEFPQRPSLYKHATKTSVGWNKYFCTGCSCTKLEYVYYDPTNDEITVVVNTGDGEKEVNVKANAVFQVLKDAQGNKYTITAVKAFDSYEADQIVAIYIPAGISEVKILSSNPNSSIKKITFGAELDATVTSLVGLQSLENIVIENVKKLVFEGECAAKTIKSIKSDFPGATVEYKDSAFIGQTNLTELKLSKGSMYSFGAKSFGDTGVTSLEFVDGCIVSFTGKQAFYNSKLEYLYVGKGIIDLPNSPFDCCYYLQKVILMDVTNISEYAFRSMNKGQNPCVVYHHAETLTLNVNSFNQSHGVILYTKANVTTGFNACASKVYSGVSYPAYTIYHGISHDYVKTEVEPTCTSIGGTLYVTSCPCGKYEGVKYKVFKGQPTTHSVFIELSCINIEEPILPHTLESIVAINYVNGYTKMGYNVKNCTMCQSDITEDIPTVEPLVLCYGYSVSEVESALSVKYYIDEETLEKYQEANSFTLEYGSVVALKKSLGNNAPLYLSGAARKGVIKMDSSKEGYSTNIIKLTNIGDAQKSLNFVMSLYLKDSNGIFYIQDAETVSNPSGVSYKEVKELADYYESLSLALPVSTGDEE